MKVSIIIPVLNEADNIARLLRRLQEGGGGHIAELMVVDGGSTDDTVSLAKSAGAEVLQSPRCGRAVQMNFGAHYATGEVLYFVHGDTLPPHSYMTDVLGALEEGYPIGGFRFRFESSNPLLRLNSFMTRFDFLWCRGGDQSLFVTRPLFDELGGYHEKYCIMEEYDFMIRARQQHPFKIIQKDVLISARKYRENGYFRVQIANLVVFRMFRKGREPQEILATYRKLLNWR